MKEEWQGKKTIIIELRDNSELKIKAGFPGGTSGKEPACQRRRHKRHEFNPSVGKIPGGGHGNPFHYSCLENPHGQMRLAGYSPWGHKESDMTE